MELIQKKNLQFYAFLEETFNLNKCKTWQSLSTEITLEKIKKTYKYFSFLFPQGIDYVNSFKEPENKFRTIHYGNLNGNKIINDIVRFSLYSEEIIVFHPLQNPSITNQKINPIKNPRYWLDDFLDSLYFYIVIKKWVEAGIVKLIINPVQFDFNLRDKLHLEALGRAKETLEEDNEFWSEYGKQETSEMLANTYINKSKEFIYKSLLNMDNPKFTTKEALEISERIFIASKNHNPLYDKINIPRGSSIVASKMGASLEEIKYISQLTGSNIYTSNPMSWKMLKSNQNEFWTKFGHVYSKANMTFLNNVDTSFVLNLRKEGRLTALRLSLKSLFDDLSKIDSTELSEGKINELNNHLLDSIRTSDAEWNLIKTEAESKRRYWAYATAATSGIPIINHEVSIISILFGATALLANSIKNEKTKIQYFRQTNPMSVYVDLKHKNEGFFSDIKNCLF